MISSIRNIALIAFFTLVSVFDINAAKAESTTLSQRPHSGLYEVNSNNVNARETKDGSISQQQFTNVNVGAYNTRNTQENIAVTKNVVKNIEIEKSNSNHFYIGASAIGGMTLDFNKPPVSLNDSVAILGLQVRTGYEFGLGQQFFVATELFYNAFFYSTKVIPNTDKVTSVQSMMGFRLRPGITFGQSSKFYLIVGAVGAVFVDQTEPLALNLKNFETPGNIRPGLEVGFGVSTNLSKYASLRLDATYSHFFANSPSVTMPKYGLPVTQWAASGSQVTSDTSVFGVVLASVGLDFYPFAGL